MRPPTRIMTGMPPVHQLTLLQGGQQFFPALEQALDAARREVRLETYIFEFDASGQAIAEALNLQSAGAASVWPLLPAAMRWLTGNSESALNQSAQRTA